MQIIQCFGLAACLCAPFAHADTFRSYHIGNSLTGDGHVGAAPSWSSSAGVDWHTASHLRCNQSLAYIQANPTDTCFLSKGYAGYQTDVATEPWDAITLQPFQTSFNFPSTMGTDVAVIADTIDRARANPANASTTFYIYEAWPTFEPEIRNSFNAADWLAAYQAPVIDAADTPTLLAGEYFDALLPRARAVTDATIFTVPAGDVIEELAIRYGDGLLPGMSFGETIYRDRVHLTFDIGRVVSGMTFFAVLHGTHPAQITNDFSIWVGNNPYRLTRELQRTIADVVWDVVANDPDTGLDVLVGDFDGSGSVEQGDLDLVLTEWGVEGVPAWTNAAWVTPGIDQDELDAVLTNWGSDAAPDFLLNPSVPEPIALLPVFALSACGFRIRFHDR